MLHDDVRLVSVDDHIIEPPDTWTSRLPKRFLEDAPRVVDHKEGQAWRYNGLTVPIELGIVRLLDESVRDQRYRVTSNGEDRYGYARFEEMRPSCYDSSARLADMDLDGVDVQLGFPNFPRFAGHRFLGSNNPALDLACIRAYNDFVIEEWCAADPDRYIPMAVLPIGNVEEAVREVARIAALGFRAVAFSENPTVLGLPSTFTDHWDPLFAAISDHDLTTCMHIGSSSQLATSSADAPRAVMSTLIGINSMTACVDWFFNGLLDRFPRLRIAFSEGGAGWFPHVLERAEAAWVLHQSTMSLPRRPHEIFRDHMYLCIVSDEVAIRMVDVIGEDNLMWETDFPHNEGLWPNSRKNLERLLADVPEETCRKIGERNARRVFRFPAPAGQAPRSLQAAGAADS